MRLNSLLATILVSFLSSSVWADPPVADSPEGTGDGTGQATPAEVVVPPMPGSGILPQDTSDHTIVLVDLGNYPLCEASDIVREPYNDTRFLIADNEVIDRLFEYSLLPEGMALPYEIVMPDENRPRDIEALATWTDHVLVVGSHDRNNVCRTPPRRQRLRILEWQIDRFAETGYIDTADSWLAVIRRPDICLNALFEAPAPAPASTFCRLLIDAAAQEDEDRCEGSMNIEGAVALPTGSTSGDTVRIWLGLRAPLIENKAVIVRLIEGLNAFRFDTLTLIDLQGRGIRTLTADATHLWGIGGGTADSTEPSVLFRIPLSSLAESGVIQPEVLRSDLPAGAEGLVVLDDRALVLIDGSRAESGVHTCAQPAQQGWFWLPRQNE